MCERARENFLYSSVNQSHAFRSPALDLAVSLPLPSPSTASSSSSSSPPSFLRLGVAPSIVRSFCCRASLLRSSGRALRDPAREFVASPSCFREGVRDGSSLAAIGGGNEHRDGGPRLLSFFVVSIRASDFSGNRVG